MLARFDMHELSLLDSTSAKSHLTVPSRIARLITNKAGYTATIVACGWAGAVMETVTGTFGQER